MFSSPAGGFFLQKISAIRGDKYSYQNFCIKHFTLPLPSQKIAWKTGAFGEFISMLCLRQLPV